VFNKDSGLTLTPSRRTAGRGTPVEIQHRAKRSVTEGPLTNEEKQTRIRPWIDPEERVTVHFLDAPDLNTTVTGCTDQVVDLSIETHVPHLKQSISIPLRQVEVTEDFSHYTRDPERPLQHQRLMLVINEKRPPIIY
jgi:hypothetical protein